MTTPTFIKASSSLKVYVLLDGVRRWIPDEQTFFSLGLNFGMVDVQPDAKVNPIPEGQSVLPIWCAAKTKTDPAVHIILNGKKHHIIDQQTFFALGLDFKNVVQVTDTVLNAIPSSKPTASITDSLKGFYSGYQIFRDIIDSTPIGCDPGEHYEPMYPILEQLGISPDLGKCVPDGDGGNYQEGDYNASGDDDTSGHINAFGVVLTLVRHGNSVVRMLEDPANSLRRAIGVSIPSNPFPSLPNPFRRPIRIPKL